MTTRTAPDRDIRQLTDRELWTEYEVAIVRRRGEVGAADLAREIQVRQVRRAVFWLRVIGLTLAAWASLALAAALRAA